MRSQAVKIERPHERFDKRALMPHVILLENLLYFFLLP